MLVIKLTKEENDKLLNFFVSEKLRLEKRIETYKREYDLLAKATSIEVLNSNKEWVKEMNSHIKSYVKALEAESNNIFNYTSIIESITSNKEINISEIIANKLKELYVKERAGKSVEAKYNYYPRLKRAKEATMYVFSNKVKEIMEVKNVKFA